EPGTVSRRAGGRTRQTPDSAAGTGTSPRWAWTPPFISSAPATSHRASLRRATSKPLHALRGGRPSRRPSTMRRCLTTPSTVSPLLRRSDPRPPDLHSCRSGGLFLSPQGHGTVTIKVFCLHRLDATIRTALCLTHRPGRTDRHRHRGARNNRPLVRRRRKPRRPPMSTTGFEKRIAEYAPNLSRGQVKKIARKVAARAERMQTEHDFYDALRVLGISSDPTARKAIKNMETAQ